MKIRAIAKVFLLLAAATLPAAVTAENVVLRAGMSYSQSDAWPAGQEHTKTPHLDVDLALDARGVIVSRDVVDYRLGAGYRRVTDEVNGVRTGLNRMLKYNASAAVLRNAVSPVSLILHAAREDSTFASDPTRDIFGEAVTDTAGATLALRSVNLPAFMGGYTWTRLEEVIPDLPLHTMTSHAVTSTMRFGNEAFGFDASYGGQFREGTFAADNVATHDISASARARVGANELLLESQADLRSPPQLGPGTFDQRSSAFRAFFSNPGTLGSRRVMSYTYAHTIIETPDVPAREQARQGIRYESDLTLAAPTLFLRWSVDTSLSQERSGTDELRSTGETLGTELWAQRTFGATTYEAHAGPLVGLLQSEENDDVGYGANAGLRATRPLWSQSLHLDWSANYAKDLFAVGGWSFRQSLSGSLTGRMGIARVSALVRASAFRTSSPIGGEGAGRSLEASARASFRTVDLDARVGLQQGIVGATPSQFMGDGLLLPAPFNSRAIDVAAGASFRLFPGLSAGTHLRAASSHLPGRPSIEEVEATASIVYAYGRFGAALEDRVTRYERDTGWDTVNGVFFRVYRSFGW